MATINFLYRSTKDKANLHLRLLYRFNNTDFVFGASTKFEVSKHYWSKEHKKTNFKKTNDVIELNEIQTLKEKQTEVSTELNKIENHILNAFNIVNTDEVNKQWLQTQIDYYYNPPKEEEQLPTELIKYIDFYIEARRHELKPVMVKRCNVIKSKLLKFETHLKTKILIENVNGSFKNSLLDFEKKNQYSLSTIKRELVFIKTICTHAKKKGLKVSLELDDISKIAKKDNVENANRTFVYLNDADLIKLENIKPNKLTKTFEDVRNWLIISCYTGQRISDFMRFNSSMIKIQKNIKYIAFTQVKTGHEVSIPLHTKILKILDNNNNEFPKQISDAKYNEYVKEVCRIAKIDEVILGGKISNLGTDKEPIWRKEIKEYKKYELVSSHIGRRSFATNNFNIMPTSLLKTITSHKTEAQLLIYCGKSDNDLLEEISKYFQ